MLSNGLPSRMATSGLWSVETTRWSFPMVKYFVEFRAHTMQASSPSTAEYLDSASLQNLLPARTSRQPSLQQVVVSFPSLPGPWSQCFWLKLYPKPSLDQSVAKQVILPMSNLFIPFSALMTIFFFASTNILSSWVSQ